MNGSFVRRDNTDLVLSLTVQPKSSKDELLGDHNGRCKVRITAPPVDGKANLHLIKYLAKLFRVSKSQVIIEKGETNKHKQVRIIRPVAVTAVFDASEDSGD
jgi:uncharacterized protein (TIGR00251 family)